MPKKGEKHVTAGQKRWMGEFVTPTTDWQTVVLEMLLEAGTDGVLQSVLTNRVFKLVSAADVRQFLESYRVQQGVQRFTIGNGTVWRATTKLMKLV